MPRHGGDRWSIVVAAGLAIFMAQLDTTIVNVALPTMGADLHAQAGVLEWVVLGYLIPLIALSLLCGRWLDGSGQRAAATIASAGFAVASVLVAAAPQVIALVIARVGQGAFAAALLAAAPVLAVDAVREQARGRALGVVSTLAPLGALTGPALGGQLVDLVGWRVIFLVNVPVAVAVLLLVRRLDDRRRLRAPEWWWVGEAMLLAAAAILALGALSLATTHGLPWLLGLAVAAAPVLWWRRTRTSRPVRELVAERGMRAPHVALLTSYTAVLAAQFLVPFFMQQTLHTSAGVVGLTLLAYPAASALVGLASGTLADRRGPRAVAAIGAAVCTVGLVLLAPLQPWTPVAIGWRLAVVGVGFGLLVTAVQTAALANAGPDRLGLTTATTNLARQAGLAVGPAVATLAWGLGGYGASGMRAGFVAAAVFAGASVVAAACCEPLHRAESAV